MWRAERLRILLRRTPGGQVCESPRPLQVDDDTFKDDKIDLVFGVFGSQRSLQSPFIGANSTANFENPISSFHFNQFEDSSIQTPVESDLKPSGAASSTPSFPLLKASSTFLASAPDFATLGGGTNFNTRVTRRKEAFKPNFTVPFCDKAYGPKKPKLAGNVATSNLPAAAATKLTAFTAAKARVASDAPLPSSVNFFLGGESTEDSSSRAEELSRNRVVDADLLERFAKNCLESVSPSTSKKSVSSSSSSSSSTTSPLSPHPQPPTETALAALHPIARVANDTGAESDFRLAEFYHANGQFEAEAWQLYVAAGRGKVEAMYNLGVCYALGHGVERNDDTALEYFRKAVEKGNLNAMYAYSHRLLERRSLSSKESAAVSRLMLRAAEKGEYDAMMYTACDLGFRDAEDSRMAVLFESRKEASEKALSLLRKVVKRVPCEKARAMLKQLERERVVNS